MLFYCLMNAVLDKFNVMLFFPQNRTGTLVSVYSLLKVNILF